MPKTSHLLEVEGREGRSASSMAKDRDRTATYRREDLPALDDKAPCLVVVEGASIGLEVLLDKPEMIVGRTDDADVPVDDKLVSRDHAKVIAGPGDQYFLLDNDSTNGTFINNQQISRAPLREGDKVRVGSTVLRFSFHDEVDKEYHRRIYDLITYDDLTGLLTLRPFYRELERELARSERLGLNLAVLMMDIDHFKDVNDTYGHQVGSMVLKECGRLIRQALRYNDAAARYGGEEFIAYLPNTAATVGHSVAERVRRAIEGYAFEYRESRPPVTISIGIAMYPIDAGDVESLVRAADEALYRAKDRGRNRVVEFSGERETRAKPANARK